MGREYNQLNLEDRERIAILKAEGKSIRQIGRELGRTHSTIVRELKRNAPPIRQGRYLPHKAHERAKQKKILSGQRQRLKRPLIESYVKYHLKMGWSPEQIAGRLPLDYAGVFISHEAIYQYIYTESPDLIGCLARRHKKRHRKGHPRKYKKCHIPNRISIAERPPEIGERRDVGHWEADLVMSGAGKTALNVLCERRSRYTLITKLPDKTALFTRQAILQRLSDFQPSVRQSITYDNGPENTDHQFLNRLLGTKSYFCRPYHSWEKGTVENTIGLIRRFAPKKTDFATVTDSGAKYIEKRLNSRPRKCLCYQTPSEVLRRLTGGALPD
jgi:IS30 family transposase